MITTRRHVLALAAALFAAGGAAAQAWPTKPVRIIVPYPPGGSSDIIARSISQPLNGRHVRVAEKPVLAGRNDAWLGPVSARSFHEFERRSGAVRLDPTQDGAAGG